MFESIFSPDFSKSPTIPPPLCLREPIALFLAIFTFGSRLLVLTLSYLAKKVLPLGRVTFLETALFKYRLKDNKSAMSDVLKLKEN